MKDIIETLLQSLQNLENYKFLIIFSFLLFYTIRHRIKGKTDSSLNSQLSEIRRIRINGSTDIPPHYPNGWIPVLESRELAVNQVKHVIAFGQELVAFRGKSNKVYISDAFCPHLGANLGFGGKVVYNSDEECIKCPFHDWVFNGSDGVCDNIPDIESCGVKSVNARLKTLQVLELNGIIFVWFHINNECPLWQIEKIDEIQDKEYSYTGKITKYTDCHIQEIIENSADCEHFKALHLPGLYQFRQNIIINKILSFVSKFIYFKYEPKWKENDSGDKHKSSVSYLTDYYVFGIRIARILTEGEMIGPAFGQFYVSSLDMMLKFKVIFLMSFQPIMINRNKVLITFYSDPTFISWIISHFVRIGIDSQISRDKLMWDNKIFLKNPILSKHEKSISKFRKWFKQFYSD